MKRCSTCKIEKDETEFHKDRTKKDGLQNKCKACNKAYYEANKDKIKAKDKAYYEANKDKIKAKKKAYYEANQENIKAYYEANREKNRAKTRNNNKARQEVSKAFEAKNGFWSEEEIQFLIVNFYKMTVLQLAINLGRTYDSTKSKIGNLRKKGVL